jgi:ribosomal protein S18 acetylase RimI-like enzyme
MLTIRPARWPDDAPALAALDTSFVTAQLFRLVREEFSARLVEEDLSPPLRKVYPFDPADPAERSAWDWTAVAEDGGGLAGFAAAQYTAWNRRVILWHLYVAPSFRRWGVGTALLTALKQFAQSAGARCVWLETQNVNYPAIQFYCRAGFRFCGFDETLYDPAGQERQEIALFFARMVTPPRSDELGNDGAASAGADSV